MLLKLLVRGAIGWAVVTWVGSQPAFQESGDWARQAWAAAQVIGSGVVTLLQPVPDVVVMELPPIQVGVVPVVATGDLAAEQLQPYGIVCREGDRLSATVAPDDLWLILSTGDDVMVQQGAIATEVQQGGAIRLDVRNPGDRPQSYRLTISVK